MNIITASVKVTALVVPSGNGSTTRTCWHGYRQEG